MIDGIHGNPTVYLNGSWLPLSDAKVSVLDRGFIFGDGVYEVLPVYGGKPFRFQSHLSRLLRSLTAIRIQAPMPEHQWASLFAELITRGEGRISLFICRSPEASQNETMPFLAPRSGQPSSRCPRHFSGRPRQFAIQASL